MDESETGGVAAVIDRFEQHRKPELLTVTDPVTGDDIPLLAFSSGRLVAVREHLLPWRAVPDRREGTAEVQDLASFVALTVRHKDADSALFADQDTAHPSLTAVIDYHEQGEDGLAGPRFCRHRVRYAFPLSKEWQAWVKMDGIKMDQADFAAFLEERIIDVAYPPAFLQRATVDAGEPADRAQSPGMASQGGDFGAQTPDERLAELVAKIGGKVATPQKLMELSRGLAVYANEAVLNQVNLASGESQLQFKTEHTDADGKPIVIPNLFLITIPVFLDGIAYRLPVRLRYRKAGGGIVWFYELYRAQEAVEDAFRAACAEAAEQTALPLYYGKPELHP